MLWLTAKLALIALSSVVPGLLALSALPASWRERTVTPLTAIPLAFSFSFVLIGAVQFLVFSTGVWGDWMRSVGLTVYLLLCLVLGMRARRVGDPVPLPPARLAAGFALFLVYLLALVALCPSFATGFTADWALYYPNTYVYLNEVSTEGATKIQMEYLVKRTPLMSLYGSFFCALFGQSYGTFQLGALVANAYVYWVVILLAATQFGSAAARLGVVILALSPAAIRQVVIPEPKMAAAVLVLTALYLHLATRDPEDPGDASRAGVVCAGLVVAGYMTHPSSLLYGGWIYVDQLWRWVRRRGPPGRTLWLSSALFGLLLIVPWWAWIGSAFGLPALASPPESVAPAVSVGPSEYLATRLHMIATTLFYPEILVDALSNAGDGGWRVRLHQVGDAVLRAYEQTYAGGATVTVSLAALALCCLRRPSVRRGKLLSPMAGYLALGALACFLILVSPDMKGQATNVTSPLFVLFLVVVGARLAVLGRSWLAAILAWALLECAAVRAVTFVLSLDRWQPRLEPGNIWSTLGRPRTMEDLAPLIALAALALLGFLALLLARQIEPGAAD